MAADMICQTLLAGLPADQADERVIRLARKHVETLRAWLQEKKADAVVISSRENFAWLSAGGDSHVVETSMQGTGSLLITPDDQYLFAYEMDGPRLMEEQVPGQGYRLVTTRWFEDDPSTLAVKRGGKRILADMPLEGAVNRSAEIGRLHDPLDELELNRLRWLGRSTGLVLEELAGRLQPGMTEWQIAGLCRELFHAQHINLDVLLAGVDERARELKHFIPGDKKLEKYLLINPSARRWGLHANVSRCVHFGTPDMLLRQSYLDAAGVVTEMLGACREGARHAKILETMKNGFARRGQPEGWMEHFPGGVTGYLLADCRCLSGQRLVRGQAYDWFATRPGVMVEELSLLTTHGLEIPSLGATWPLGSFSGEYPDILLPEMAVR
jgi:Xaa-Pro dipeptidase